MIPLTPLQLLCGGWEFLPSPAAVFGEPRAMVQGASVTGIQWPTGVIEYGISGVWSRGPFAGGAGVRRLGFSTSVYESVTDTLPSGATYEEIQGVAALAAFQWVGVKIVLEEQRLSGVFDTQTMAWEGSLVHGWTVHPRLTLEGRIWLRMPGNAWGGGMRITFARRGILQVAIQDDVWRRVGGCGGIREDAGWLGMGSLVFPEWGTLWGVGGGLLIGTFALSWAYLVHPYGRPVFGMSIDWFPERGSARS